MKQILKLSFLSLMLLLIVWLIYHNDLSHLKQLDYLKSRLEGLRKIYQEDPLQSSTYYLLGYILITSLSLPFATPISLMGGAVFGLPLGTLLTSFASTIGATLSFLLSRMLLREWVERNFQKTYQKISGGLEAGETSYLLSLRLLPIFPFWLVNLCMGLSKMRTIKYFWVSQLGMLPGTLLYINAGTQLATLESLNDLKSPKIILSFALLAAFPLFARFILSRLKGRQSSQ